MRGIGSARPTSLGSGQVLSELTWFQHLHPHQPVGDALQRVCSRRGLELEAANQVVAGLGFDQKVAIGRLARKQITEIAAHLSSAEGRRGLADAAA